MNTPIIQAGPDDLDVLNDYLGSDRAPPDCMDLSELDGFLAGLAAGPVLIEPSEWLPVVWDGAEPEFSNDVEAERVLGTIKRRYEDIAASLDAEPANFAPVFWEDTDGEPLVEDWAHGFMHAVSMRTEAWEPVLRDDESAILLIPIGIIAGLAVPEIGDSMPLTEDSLDELMEDADMMLTACVVGLRAFWRDAGVVRSVRH